MLHINIIKLTKKVHLKDELRRRYSFSIVNLLCEISDILQLRCSYIVLCWAAIDKDLWCWGVSGNQRYRRPSVCLPSLLHKTLHALTLYCLLYFCNVPHSVHTKPINQSVPSLNKTLLGSKPTEDKIHWLQWSSHSIVIGILYTSMLFFSTVWRSMPHPTQKMSICVF